MDSKLFRLPTKPNFYNAIATANPFDLSEKPSSAPTPDSRYPGWAAPMEDGRLVTDYSNHCSQNIPAGRQFATKEWMTKNAAQIIEVGRQRFAKQTGAIYSFDTTVVPPPAMVVDCTRADCQRQATQAAGGIGTERLGADAPPLFGTWEPAKGWISAPARTQLTQVYEGGRNTPRGGRGPAFQMQ
jgi:hypothetical protein